METQKTDIAEEHFEQIVKIGPASDNRHKPGGGIGSCTMYMVFKGIRGAVSLAVSTAWFLPCTREWKEVCIARDGGDVSGWEPRGMCVSYCSPLKLHDWQEARPNCDWIGCDCYGDVGYIMADEVFPLLLEKGSDAVFEWLKNYYHEIFDKPPQ